MNDRQREKISLMSDKKYIFAITQQNTTLSFPTNERAQRNELKFPVESAVIAISYPSPHLDLTRDFFSLLIETFFLCIFWRTTKRHSDKCIQL